MTSSTPEIGLAVATRNRRRELLRTLARLEQLPRRPPICVVDNASEDGSAGAARARHPGVRVIALSENHGAAARNLAVEALGTPLVAFNDDDSWWADDALERAAREFRRHPALGLLAAQIRVGRDGRLDPTCRSMRDSRLPDDPALPGKPVLGFVACGAVVRASAFRQVGGFERRMGVGGEERLLALDLAAAGWGLAYVDDVVAFHHPSANGRDSRGGDALRNDLWSLWLRRPLPRALAGSAQMLGAMARHGELRAIASAARGLPWALRRRRVVPDRVERQARLIGV